LTSFPHELKCKTTLQKETAELRNELPKSKENDE
jgi:hypothetical protein